MSKKNNFEIVEVFDESSNKTLEDVLWDLKWWYEDVLFNNNYIKQE